MSKKKLMTVEKIVKLQKELNSMPEFEIIRQNAVLRISLEIFHRNYIALKQRLEYLCRNKKALEIWDHYRREIR